MRAYLLLSTVLAAPEFALGDVVVSAASAPQMLQQDAVGDGLRGVLAGEAGVTASNAKMLEELLSMTRRLDPNTAISLLGRVMDSFPSEKLRRRHEHTRGGARSKGDTLIEEAAPANAFLASAGGMEDSFPLMVVKVNPKPGRSYTLTVHRDGSVVHS